MCVAGVDVTGGATLCKYTRTPNKLSVVDDLVLAATGASYDIDTLIVRNKTAASGAPLSVRPTTVLFFQ